MKKLVFLLSMVAMVAVVGGALAFKARSQNFVYMHAVTDPITDRCTLPSFFYTATNNGSPAEIRTASSVPLNFGCRTILIYRAQ